MKFTKERTDKIIKLIQAGNYAITAAQASGINERTYYNWMEKAKEEEAAENYDGEYYQFHQSIKKAENEAEARNVMEIQKDKSWQAKMTWLERKFPQRWGRTDKHSVDVDGSVDIKIQLPEDLQDD
jgi:hypothetical protein